MCLMVYLGSDEPLTPIPWDKRHPQLYVEELTEENRVVVEQFSKPHVYYVGAHTGCGCGFQHRPVRPRHHGEEMQERRVDQSRKQLRELIERLLQTQDTVELFATWIDSERDPPKIRREMSPEELTGEHREFCDQGEFIRFSRSA